MSETSRRFHYWRPTPRRRQLPWLANHSNPGISPHAVRKASNHHIDQISNKGKGGIRKPFMKCNHAHQKLMITLPTSKNPSTQNIWNHGTAHTVCKHRWPQLTQWCSLLLTLLNCNLNSSKSFTMESDNVYLLHWQEKTRSVSLTGKLSLLGQLSFLQKIIQYLNIDFLTVAVIMFLFLKHHGRLCKHLVNYLQIYVNECKCLYYYANLCEYLCKHMQMLCKFM